MEFDKAPEAITPLRLENFLVLKCTMESNHSYRTLRTLVLALFDGSAVSAITLLGGGTRGG
jgi:hypothetical protein